MTLAEKIRYHRILMGMTQEDLAKKLNTTKQTIGKYEHSIVTNLPLSRIEELSHALNVAPAYLMGWEDSPATAYPAAQELNEQEAALIELFRALAPAEKDEAVEYLRYLKDRDELEQLRLDLQAALAAQKGAAER